MLNTNLAVHDFLRIVFKYHKVIVAQTFLYLSYQIFYCYEKESFPPLLHQDMYWWLYNSNIEKSKSNIPGIGCKDRLKYFKEVLFWIIGYRWYIIIKFRINTIIWLTFDRISKNFICWNTICLNACFTS